MLERATTAPAIWGDSELSSKEYMVAFAKRLRLVREQAGYSTAGAFAREALDIDANRYRTYERGDCSPSFEIMLKIAQKTNRSLDYLMRPLD